MISEFAQHIKPAASLKMVALPKSSTEMLHEIAAAAGPAGTVTLFTGENEAGKALAAEALAHELQTDLYRIDLRAVVSKWIGETEQNLNRLFDDAGPSGAVLLFDEADALFGKRTDVKESHDRFAGIESHRGLVILGVATKDSLDPALLARAKFVVDFPN